MKAALFSKALIIIMLVAAPTILMAATEEGEERDPFSPYTWDTPPVVNDVNTPMTSSELAMNPLEKDALSTYNLVAVMMSPTQKIGVIKNKQNQEYFIYEGDVLGKEGGIIDLIHIEGIKVSTDAEVVHIPVSNKIEVVQDEEKKD